MHVQYRIWKVMNNNQRMLNAILSFSGVFSYFFCWFLLRHREHSSLIFTLFRAGISHLWATSVSRELNFVEIPIEFLAAFKLVHPLNILEFRFDPCRFILMLGKLVLLLISGLMNKWIGLFSHESLFSSSILCIGVGFRLLVTCIGEEFSSKPEFILLKFPFSILMIMQRLIKDVWMIYI